jgi:AraC-like DNA-binding protein
MRYTDLIAPTLAFLERREPKDRAILPNLTVLKSSTTSEFDAVVYNPVVCLILQGAKETTIGDQSATLCAGDALVVSHDLPVQSRITEASADKPYLAVIISLELAMVRGLYEQVGSLSDAKRPTRSLSSGRIDSKLTEAISRYLALAENSVDAQVLGPSILREIHFRLLMSPIGGMLRSLLAVDSHASRVAKAIMKIRNEYRQALSITELAQSAGMSESSFHGHFKQVTGTTPRQYQKDLRIIAARELLRTGRHSVASASFEVGYESPTHFSRDFQRKFGKPPSRETFAALARE